MDLFYFTIIVLKTQNLDCSASPGNNCYVSKLSARPLHGASTQRDDPATLHSGNFKAVNCKLSSNVNH